MQIRKPVVPKKKCLPFFWVKWVYHKLYIFQFQIFDTNWPSLLYSRLKVCEFWYRKWTFPVDSSIIWCLTMVTFSFHILKDEIFHIFKLLPETDPTQIWRIEKNYEQHPFNDHCQNFLWSVWNFYQWFLEFFKKLNVFAWIFFLQWWKRYRKNVLLIFNLLDLFFIQNFWTFLRR